MHIFCQQNPPLSPASHRKSSHCNPCTQNNVTMVLFWISHHCKKYMCNTTVWISNVAKFQMIKFQIPLYCTYVSGFTTIWRPTLMNNMWAKKHFWNLSKVFFYFSIFFLLVSCLKAQPMNLSKVRLKLI